MPTYTIETPSGRTLEIEAGDEATALRGAQEWETANTKPPAQDGVISRAHREGKEAFGQAVSGATDFGDLTKDGSIGSVLKTGGALLSAINAPLSYPLAAAGSLLGSGTSAALTGDVNKVYDKVRPEMDKALMAMGPRGKVPAPALKQVGAEARQLYDDVLSRAKYVPVSDQEFSAISQNATGSLYNKNMRPFEYPWTHNAVQDLANPYVNDLAEVVSRRRAMNDPGKGVVADKKALDTLKKREGVAIGEARQSLMSDIDAIDPMTAERLLKSDKEWTVFNQAKDVDKFIKSGRNASNFDVSGALRRNFGKIANDADALAKYTPEEQALIEGLAGGKYNMLSVIGKLDPRRGGLIGLGHGALGAATSGVSLVGSGLGFAAQVLSNRMALSKANKLGEMIRSRSSSMKMVTGPMESWGEAAMAFQGDPSPKNFARLSLASRNFSNNLSTIGIEFSPANLMKSITGPATGRAEGEDDE